MPFDWIDRWLTPCPLHLREMGYARELFGIRRRWRQWSWAWASHCDNTRRVLLSAVSRCQRRRKAVVFGSGYLHDVPLRELSEAFAQVILVDLIHPLSVRRAVRRYRNVELLARDVTNTVEGVWLAIERPGSPLPSSHSALFLGDPEVDYVASVNLLSQLPCMPEQYLRRFPIVKPEAITAYCRDVIMSHIRYLQSLPGVVTLIADFEAVTMSQVGREITRRSTLHGIEMPFDGESWIWTLVPRFPRRPHHAEHLLVRAIEDINAAPAADSSV